MRLEKIFLNVGFLGCFYGIKLKRINKVSVVNKINVKCEVIIILGYFF